MIEIDIDQRLGRLEVGLEAVNQQVEGISRKMEAFRSELISGFDGMDAKIDTLGHGMDAHFDSLNRTIVIGGIVIFTTSLATLGAAIAAIFLAS